MKDNVVNNNDVKLKTCAMCFQKIDARAIRCPFCRTWQTKIGILIHHPAVITILTAIPILFVYISLSYFTSQMFNAGESFDLHRGDLVIENTELTHGENSCGATLAILGKIHNQGDISWKDIQLEANFYNKDNKLIDTEQNKKYSFVSLKKSKSPIKFSIKREFPLEYYSSYEIKVISARDVSASF